MPGTTWSPAPPSSYPGRHERPRGLHPGGAPGRPLVVAQGLTKRFGDFTAVDGIDFEVRMGEAFGFLGPNGAGKSSTMRMVGCVSPITEGSLRLFDLDPRVTGLASGAGSGSSPSRTASTRS